MNISTSKCLADDAIRNRLAPFGIHPDVDLCQKVRAYAGLLLQWNEKINLTSILDPVEIIERHFGESMFAASAVGVSRGRLADVGSGAGFPGLALKIMLPELEVALLEPNAKKAAFLAEVVRVLRLAGVSVLRSGFKTSGIDRCSINLVTSRALDPKRGLLDWAHGVLSATGRLVLWSSSETFLALGKSPRWEWESPVWIPLSKTRCLLIAKPIK